MSDKSKIKTKYANMSYGKIKISDVVTRPGKIVNCVTRAESKKFQSRATYAEHEPLAKTEIAFPHELPVTQFFVTHTCLHNVINRY